MKSALLVISFGTSYEETRKKTIEAIEKDLMAAFPQRIFYRAWTSGRIIKKLKETKGLCYDNVQEAMERMRKDGITDVLIQPTHMLPGLEFETTRNTIASYQGQFENIRMGEPLLTGKEDVKALAKALEEIFLEVTDAEVLAFMGHGSAHAPFPVYEQLDEQFQKDGCANFCVGTVEFEPGFAAVQRRIQKRKPDKVYLTPLLVVAGDHALNDMAGDDDDSWKSQLEREGVKVACIVRGMGEYPMIRKMYVKNAQNAKPMC